METPVLHLLRLRCQREELGPNLRLRVRKFKASGKNGSHNEDAFTVTIISGQSLFLLVLKLPAMTATSSNTTTTTPPPATATEEQHQQTLTRRNSR